MLYLHVGQCGNQLGEEYWELCTAARQAGEHSPLFCPEDGTARCVLVDTEPKVVSSVLNRGIIPVDARAVVYEQSGRANNWAMGFHGPRAGSSAGHHAILQATMEGVRHQVEKMDCFQGTMMMHSMSGGTGAGLGSRVLQEMRDIYANPYIATVSVGPFQCGDTPLHNYNSIFTLVSADLLKSSADSAMHMYMYVYMGCRASYRSLLIQ